MNASRIAYNRIVCNSMGGVAGLIAALTMLSQSANAQCVIGPPDIVVGGVVFNVAVSTTQPIPNPCATSYGSGPEIAREVVNSTIQSIVQSVRDGIQTTNGAAVPGTAGLMRFTAEQKGDAVYQEAFGALAYAKEPVFTKVVPAPAAPSLIWGVSVVGSVDSQRTSIFGGQSPFQPDSHATTAVGVGAVDVTKIGIFGAKDALNIMVLGSDAFTNVGGVHTTTPGVGTAITYINGGASVDFIFNSGFSRTDALSNVTAYSYSTDFNNRWDAPDHWWLESTFGATYAEAHSNGAVIGQVWTVQGGARVGTEFVLANGVKVQPSFTALAYTNLFESGSQFIIPNGTNGSLIVSGDQGQLWGKGAAKLNFIIDRNLSAYVEGNVRGTTGNVTATGYGGLLGLRWTW